MRESISGPHLRCITSAGLLCVLPVPSLCEKTAVGVRGCPGWPLWCGHADTTCRDTACGINVYSCWEVTPFQLSPKTPSTYFWHRLYTAGNSSPWMAKAFNYWLVVNQKVWELEIKRQSQATGIIYGSGAIFSMNHQRCWLLHRCWILIPASMAPFSWRRVHPDTFYSPHKSCQKWNEPWPPATVWSLTLVSPQCCTHSQFSKVKNSFRNALIIPFSVSHLYTRHMSVRLRRTWGVAMIDLGCMVLGKFMVNSKCSYIHSRAS